MKAFVPLTAILAVATLTACATGRGDMPRENRAGTSASTAPGTMMGPSSGGSMGEMDKQSMCDMYTRMMNARTPEERQAMMNENMKNMSPQMREQRMEMMRQQCR